ncbi:hypothetical protein BDV18DRAFT_159048 [Aspergillus unguis]
MPKGSPAYLLGGTSLISTSISTIFNGICYGFSSSSIWGNSSIEVATVTLNIITCLVVLALVLVYANASKINARTPWKACEAIAYGLGTGYLLLAAAASAGTIAWSTIQSASHAEESTGIHSGRSLFIARCIVWAISVLTQGMLCGVLLSTPRTTPANTQDRWPTLISYELNAVVSNDTSRNEAMRKEACNTAVSISEYDSQRPSLDTLTQPRSSASASASASVSRTTSYRSDRYSGKMSTQTDSTRESFDSNTTCVPVSRPESTACTRRDTQEEHTKSQSQSQLQPQPQPQRFSQRASSQIKRSLDSVMLRPTSSLSAPGPSMAAPEPPTKAKRPLPRLKVPDESNIHPLFRSCSLSPPPTATPTSMVLASPEAGQTIDKKALQRMRSSREVRPRASWRRSPLFEQTDHLFEDRPDDNRPVSVLSYNSFGSRG